MSEYCQRIAIIGLQTTRFFTFGSFLGSVLSVSIVGEKLITYAFCWPSGGPVVFRGEAGGGEAGALRHLTPRLNYSGGSPRDVTNALDRLHAAGSAEALCRMVARPASQGATLHKHYPKDVQLAIEIAAHEEVERRAMDGELALLAHEWRAAEEIASIVEGELGG